MICACFILNTRQHRSGLSVADWCGCRLSTISGHNGLQVMVITRCGRPRLFTTARASSVSLLRFRGDPWKDAGSNFPGVPVPDEFEIAL